LFQIIDSVAAAHRACLPSAVRASDAANVIKPVKEYKKQTIANSSLARSVAANLKEQQDAEVSSNDLKDQSTFI
jgi:hypothetical protein